MTTIEVRQADFAAERAVIRRIRFAVFVDEQKVPASLEIDERDPLCLHVLAFLDGEPVGTGRIDIVKDGKIGRVAVLAPARRRGVGRALMRRLHELGEARGLPGVWCHAQVSARPFYQRLGYRVASEPFLEAGIEHVRMEKRLQSG